MTKRKRIALITVWFPPQMSVATNRMLAFAEYLSEDFEVEVFALNDKAGEAVFFDRVKVHYNSGNAIDRILKSSTKDSALKHKAKTALRIIRSKIQPDILSGWMKKTIATLTGRHAEQPFDLIISSFAPSEPHEAVLAFKKKFTDIPWIADMRDEMSLNPGTLPHLKQKYSDLEEQINHSASAIISVSKPIVDEYARICPKVPHLEEIRNGYSHDMEFPEWKKGDSIKMGYFGSLYGKRKPGLFFEALETVMKKYPEISVELSFVGAHKNFDIPSVLENVVKIEPSLGYADAIKRMAEMDVNLVMEPGSERKGVFTGKLFDYLSVQRPVLAMADKEDVAAQLIVDTNAGYVGEFGELEDNIEALTLVFEDWKTGSMKIISAEDASKLHRKYQVEKLKQLINQILAQ